MKINLYMDGGIGDHLLGHKFSVQIKEKYPNSLLHVFSDTQNNFAQKTTLNYLYPNFYESITVIADKKYKKCIIDSQFGTEEYRGGVQNLKESVLKEMTEDCDKLYSLHVDSLDFIHHDYNWSKDFDKIPKPSNYYNRPEIYMGKYLISNIISATGREHLCEQFWTDRLISEIDSYCLKNKLKHLIISTPETNHKYENILKKCQVTSFINAGVEEVCDFISGAAGLIGIDSCWRLISSSYDVPTITISKNCSQPGVCPISHQIRWLINPKTTFPIHWNTQDIIKLMDKMLENQLFSLFPSLAFAPNLDQILIRRNYKVNEEKSILN